MRRDVIIYSGIAIWALIIAWSFMAGAAVEGPRNIDTGFRRLDVFFRWQLAGTGVAITVALFGFLSVRQNPRLRWIGLIPIGLTGLVIAGIAIFAMLYDPRPPSGNSPSTPTVVTPVD